MTVNLTVCKLASIVTKQDTNYDERYLIVHLALKEYYDLGLRVYLIPCQFY